MKLAGSWWVAAAVALLFWARTAAAHRLDELLQATILTVTADEVQGSMRVIPGVAVAPAVIAEIDGNGDGVFSKDEQRAYAERVLDEVSLTVDGKHLRMRLVSAVFADAASMRDGLGEMRIVFEAEVPPGGRERTLVMQQLHRQDRAAYLVNCTVPETTHTKTIQIVGQRRNEDQSRYELDYLQTSSGAGALPARLWMGVRDGFSAAGFGSLFRLGVRHIAEGTDHLLFLLALLLPAPLLVAGRRWAGTASVRGSVMRMLKVVTAFTVGHSITLGLAAWGVVSVPARPVEVLIAVSILVSAIHAWRPIFPGREAVIAGLFGLVHGLAFAATLSSLGVGGWQRLFGILAFNLGIEAMQLAVVAVAMPMLILLSHTRAYPGIRVAGAAAAVFAAVLWIGQRL